MRGKRSSGEHGGIQTFDVDNKGEKDVIEIMQRLTRCKNIAQVLYRISSGGNGYHIRIVCGNKDYAGDCDVCRLCFDSDVRFYLDQTIRKPHQRNILWKLKSYRKGGKSMQGETGPWIRWCIGSIQTGEPLRIAPRPDKLE